MKRSFTFSFILLLCLYEKVALKNVIVDVRYLSSSNVDYLDVHTDDIYICTKFDAFYVSRNRWANTVTCKCGSKQSFFGLNGQQPKCRNENYGKLFGMINYNTVWYRNI